MAAKARISVKNPRSSWQQSRRARQQHHQWAAVNADVFEAFVEQVLLPTLHAGDVVVMDNLSSHRRSRTRELIRSRDAEVLYLPPYSPDLNPIENVFAKIKQCLRSLACRTREMLWETMQSVLDRVTPADAINCIRHCGYTLQSE